VKSQRNDVFQALISRNIDPDGFEWREVLSELGLPITIAALFHIPTGYYYRFEVDSQSHLWAIRSPGANIKRQIERTGNWPTQMKIVEQWLDMMKREIEEPDFWETIRSQSSLLEAGSNEVTENTSFSKEEQARIAQDLSEIKEFLFTTIQIREEQKTFVEQRLRYLLEASNRLGRKDWLNILFSGLISIIIGLALAPDKSADLLRFSAQVFHWLVRTPHFFPIGQ